MHFLFMLGTKSGILGCVNKISGHTSDLLLLNDGQDWQFSKCYEMEVMDFFKSVLTSLKFQFNWRQYRCDILDGLWNMTI